MDTEYEYRLDERDPTRVQVRRKPTLAQARRVLALLEGSGEAQVLP